MTSEKHQSGSDRIAECIGAMGWQSDTLLVNLQGDEPLMPPACLDQVAGLLAGDGKADVASLYWPLQDEGEAADPNVVKVVTGLDGTALYFSRSTIPHPRGGGVPAEGSWKRHVGLYAYRAGALQAFARGRATPLERTERLEQLRFLESGRRILMARACAFIPAGVDTPADLERIRAELEAASGSSASGS
jgi:3-deoxy-manno-octulosonate cytidylyltransferase (CMP-KDO synthetase)